MQLVRLIRATVSSKHIFSTLASMNYNDEKELLLLEQKLYSGYELEKTEVEALLNLPDPEALYDLAHRVTEHFRQREFDTCSILSAKVGNCPEDCKWCAQSAHYNTHIQTHPLVSLPSALAYAHKLTQQGVARYSLVASGRRLTDKEVDTLAVIYERIHSAHPKLRLCASFGLLTEKQLTVLRAAGVSTYHCNLESAPSFFPTLCTTHTQAQKEDTIRAARRVGMQICCGGIIGMGESQEQRIEFAFYLRSMGSLSIPINFLQPIVGTPLEHACPLTEEEILTTIALFRLVNPRAYLRFSGGRMQLSEAGQRKAIYIGINAAITGDFLTTTGQTVANDMQMLAECRKENSARDWE